MVVQRIVKPKTQQGKRALEERAPKAVENHKQTLVIRGAKTGEVGAEALKDILSLKKPHATMMSQKNEFRLFDDASQLERMATKLDSSLFLFGTHSKKRPNSLIMGRMFDHQVLDMFELGLSDYKGMQMFKNQKATMGIKPCVLFNGDGWDTTLETQRLKNMLLDFFRGPSDAEKISLVGLEQALTFSLCEGTIYVRCYRILLKKSGMRTPRIELDEVGPSFQFVVRRSKLGSDAMYKEALKVPSITKPKKVKNMSRDVFGTKLGRIHMKKQNIAKMQLRKVKALRKGKPAKASSTTAAGHGEPESS